MARPALAARPDVSRIRRDEHAAIGTGIHDSGLRGSKTMLCQSQWISIAIGLNVVPPSVEPIRTNARDEHALRVAWIDGNGEIVTALCAEIAAAIACVHSVGRQRRPLRLRVRPRGKSPSIRALLRLTISAYT
jgi:hypothetical protein